MNGLGLSLNPAKTQIVYCQNNNRRQRFPLVAFTFLGYTFRPRAARDRHGATFCAFVPAMSTHALKRISAQVRRWRLHRRIFQHPERTGPHDQPDRRGLDAVLRKVLPSALYPLLAHINAYLVRWIRNKYRRYDRTRRPPPASRPGYRIPSRLPALALGHHRLVRKSDGSAGLVRRRGARPS